MKKIIPIIIIAVSIIGGYCYITIKEKETVVNQQEIVAMTSNTIEETNKEEKQEEKIDNSITVEEIKIDGSEDINVGKTENSEKSQENAAPKDEQKTAQPKKKIENEKNTISKQENKKETKVENKEQQKQEIKTETKQEEKKETPKQTVGNEKLANTRYTKVNTEVIPTIINILNDEISKNEKLKKYGSKAIKAKKEDIGGNTSGFTYMFVKDITKGKVPGNYTVFEQRIRNTVGAYGKYYVYAEDEYVYDSKGINSYWSQTLVWIYITF